MSSPASRGDDLEDEMEQGSSGEELEEQVEQASSGEEIEDEEGDQDQNLLLQIKEHLLLMLAKQTQRSRTITPRMKAYMSHWLEGKTDVKNELILQGTYATHAEILDASKFLFSLRVTEDLTDPDTGEPVIDPETGKPLKTSVMIEPKQAALAPIHQEMPGVISRVFDVLRERAEVAIQVLEGNAEENVEEASSSEAEDQDDSSPEPRRNRSRKASKRSNSKSSNDENGSSDYDEKVTTRNQAKKKSIRSKRLDESSDEELLNCEYLYNHPDCYDQLAASDDLQRSLTVKARIQWGKFQDLVRRGHKNLGRDELRSFFGKDQGRRVIEHCKKLEIRAREGEDRGDEVDETRGRGRTGRADGRAGRGDSERKPVNTKPIAPCKFYEGEFVTDLILNELHPDDSDFRSKLNDMQTNPNQVRFYSPWQVLNHGRSSIRMRLLVIPGCSYSRELSMQEKKSLPHNNIGVFMELGLNPGNFYSTNENMASCNSSSGDIGKSTCLRDAIKALKYPAPSHGKKPKPNDKTDYRDLDFDLSTLKWCFPVIHYAISVVNWKWPSESMVKDNTFSFTAQDMDRGWFDMFCMGRQPDGSWITSKKHLRERGWLNDENKMWFRWALDTVRPHEVVEHVPDSTGIIYAGLKNHGATCYMNSLLQSLFHIGKFREIVYTLGKKDQVQVGNSNLIANQQKILGNGEPQKAQDEDHVKMPNAEERDGFSFKPWSRLGSKSLTIETSNLQFQAADMPMDTIPFLHSPLSVKSKDGSLLSMKSKDGGPLSNVAPSDGGPSKDAPLSTTRSKDGTVSKDGMLSWYESFLASDLALDNGVDTKGNIAAGVASTTTGGAATESDDQPPGDNQPSKDEKETNSNQPDGKETKESIGEALQELFLKMQTESTALPTTKLMDSFGWSGIDQLQQHDVQELNRILLDRIENQLKSENPKTEETGGEKKKPSLSQEKIEEDDTMEKKDFSKTDKKEEADDTPPGKEQALKNLFLGKMVNYVKCLDVDYTSEREEEFWDVQLNIRDDSNPMDPKPIHTLRESFQYFLRPEILDDKYDAGEGGFEGEERYQRAQKGIRFKEFPPVLSLQLKRFQFDMQILDMVKLNTRFEFPDELDVSEFLHNEDGEKDGQKNQDVEMGDAEKADVEMEDNVGESLADVAMAIKKDLKKDDVDMDHANNAADAAGTTNSENEMFSAKTRSEKKSDDGSNETDEIDGEGKRIRSGSQGGSPKDSKKNSKQASPKVDDKANKNGSKESQKTLMQTPVESEGMFSMPGSKSPVGSESPLGNRISSSASSKKAPSPSKSPNLYQLYAVMVHRGNLNAGHYYAMIRPYRHANWLRFDDERIQICSQNSAIEDNYGGHLFEWSPERNHDPPLSPEEYHRKYAHIPLTNAYQGGRKQKIHSAYMLVYVKKNLIEELLTPPDPLVVNPRMVAKQLFRERMLEQQRVRRYIMEMKTTVRLVMEKDLMKSIKGFAFKGIHSIDNKDNKMENIQLMNLPFASHEIPYVDRDTTINDLVEEIGDRLDIDPEYITLFLVTIANTMEITDGSGFPSIADTDLETRDGEIDSYYSNIIDNHKIKQSSLGQNHNMDQNDPIGINQDDPDESDPKNPNNFRKDKRPRVSNLRYENKYHLACSETAHAYYGDHLKLKEKRIRLCPIPRKIEPTDAEARDAVRCGDVTLRHLIPHALSAIKEEGATAGIGAALGSGAQSSSSSSSTSVDHATTYFDPSNPSLTFVVGLPPQLHFATLKEKRSQGEPLPLSRFTFRSQSIMLLAKYFCCVTRSITCLGTWFGDRNAPMEGPLTAWAVERLKAHPSFDGKVPNFDQKMKFNAYLEEVCGRTGKSSASSIKDFDIAMSAKEEKLNTGDIVILECVNQEKDETLVQKIGEQVGHEILNLYAQHNLLNQCSGIKDHAENLCHKVKVEVNLHSHAPLTSRLPGSDKNFPIITQPVKSILEIDARWPLSYAVHYMSIEVKKIYKARMLEKMQQMQQENNDAESWGNTTALEKILKGTTIALGNTIIKAQKESESLEGTVNASTLIKALKTNESDSSVAAIDTTVPESTDAMDVTTNDGDSVAASGTTAVSVAVPMDISPADIPPSTLDLSKVAASNPDNPPLQPETKTSRADSEMELQGLSTAEGEQRNGSKKRKISTSPKSEESSEESSLVRAVDSKLQLRNPPWETCLENLPENPLETYDPLKSPEYWLFLLPPADTATQPTNHYCEQASRTAARMEVSTAEEKQNGSASEKPSNSSPGASPGSSASLGSSPSGPEISTAAQVQAVGVSSKETIVSGAGGEKELTKEEREAQEARDRNDRFVRLQTVLEEHLIGRHVRSFRPIHLIRSPYFERELWDIPVMVKVMKNGIDIYEQLVYVTPDMCQLRSKRDNRGNPIYSDKEMGHMNQYNYDTTKFELFFSIRRFFKWFETEYINPYNAAVLKHNEDVMVKNGITVSGLNVQMFANGPLLNGNLGAVSTSTLNGTSNGTSTLIPGFGIHTIKSGLSSSSASSSCENGNSWHFNRSGGFAGVRSGTETANNSKEDKDTVGLDASLRQTIDLSRGWNLLQTKNGEMTSLIRSVHRRHCFRQGISNCWGTSLRANSGQNVNNVYHNFWRLEPFDYIRYLKTDPGCNGTSADDKTDDEASKDAEETGGDKENGPTQLSDCCQPDVRMKSPGSGLIEKETDGNETKPEDGPDAATGTGVIKKTELKPEQHGAREIEDARKVAEEAQRKENEEALKEAAEAIKEAAKLEKRTKFITEQALADSEDNEEDLEVHEPGFVEFIHMEQTGFDFGGFETHLKSYGQPLLLDVPEHETFKETRRRIVDIYGNKVRYWKFQIEGKSMKETEQLGLLTRHSDSVLKVQMVHERNNTGLKIKS